MATPTGKTSERWFRVGYQSAMQDMLRCLNEGGEDAAREWIKNNMTVTAEIEVSK